MAKGTTVKRPPRRGGKTAAAASAPTAAPAKPKQEYEIALSTPGEDVPQNGRRMGCPSCGAKHDFVRPEHQAGQGGTWTVPDFKCLAPCGYEVVALPVG